MLGASIGVIVGVRMLLMVEHFDITFDVTGMIDNRDAHFGHDRHASALSIC